MSEAARERSRFLRTSWRARRTGRSAAVAPVTPQADEAAPIVDIAPDDPALAHFQAAGAPVDLDTVTFDSPAVRNLKAAGVKLVVPLVASGDLIGLINLGPRLSEQEYTTDDRRLLENLASQAAPALRVAQLVREQQAEAAERERIAQELRVATLIQQNYLPQQLPELSGWDVAAFYRPAREVGGDFYDFIEFADGRLGVFTGDVTDKGVPAALVMAATRATLRAAAERMEKPGQVLAKVNDQLQREMPPRMFVTCLYGILDPETGRFLFANAGHNLPCVGRRDGAIEARATGMPLGMFPGMVYEEADVTLEHGQTLLLYSDAIPEAHDPAGQMYGFPRLLGQVGRGPRGRELIDHLLDDLQQFTGPGWEQEDDITLVVLQRSPAAAKQAVGRRLLDQFTIASAPGNERLAVERVAAAVQEVVLAPSRLERLKTAVAEGTMNAIEHGNRGRPELHVEVEVYADPSALLVRISDHGHGYGGPDDAVEAPDLLAKLRGEQSPRGWGLFLIENMVDDLHVVTDDDRSTLELIMALNGEDDAVPR